MQTSKIQIGPPKTPNYPWKGRERERESIYNGFSKTTIALYGEKKKKPLGMRAQIIYWALGLDRECG